MRIVIGALAAVALSCSAAANAEGGYIGGSAGLMKTSLEGDSPINAGIRAGYSWASGFGLEGEYTTSIADGKVEVSNEWVDFTADYSISTLGLYGTYRSAGDVYFKARLGVLSEEIDFEDSSGSDSGLSGGLGVGFRLAENVSFEADYTLVEKDVDFWSGSVMVRF